MLRIVLLALSGGAFVAALVGSLLMGQFWPPALIFGLIFAGILFERVRYRPIEPVLPTGDGWRATDERFVDPATGAMVTVWYQPASGTRRYVAAGELPPA